MHFNALKCVKNAFFSSAIVTRAYRASIFVIEICIGNSMRSSVNMICACVAVPIWRQICSHEGPGDELAFLYK